MHRVAVLGATGSIGQSALAVISENPDKLRLHSVSGYSRIDSLIDICRKHKPARACVRDQKQAAELAQACPEVDIVLGNDGLIELAQDPECDTVLAAIVGGVGLPSTLAAAKAGKRIALANKEALVMAGQLFMQSAQASGATILPVDSEHNAIFQSLPTGYVCGEPIEGLRSLWLTCSGGPFAQQSGLDLSSVTPSQAVAHPNWDMGAKISVDSATLMNKALELLEACHLFAVSANEIKVVIHPQSVIHSLVEYQDGSFINQLGQTDMKIPIAHALAYPDRVNSVTERLDLTGLSSLTFDSVDDQRFPALNMARGAFEAGQAASIWFNAINECAVDAFLKGGIRFDQITERVQRALDALNVTPINSLESVLEEDERARRWYREQFE